MESSRETLSVPKKDNFRIKILQVNETCKVYPVPQLLRCEETIMHETLSPIGEEEALHPIGRGRLRQKRLVQAQNYGDKINIVAKQLILKLNSGPGLTITWNELEKKWQDTTTWVDWRWECLFTCLENILIMAQIEGEGTDIWIEHGRGLWRDPFSRELILRTVQLDKTAVKDLLEFGKVSGSPTG